MVEQKGKMKEKKKNKDEGTTRLGLMSSGRRRN